MDPNIVNNNNKEINPYHNYSIQPSDSYNTNISPAPQNRHPREHNSTNHVAFNNKSSSSSTSLGGYGIDGGGYDDKMGNDEPALTLHAEKNCPKIPCVYPSEESQKAAEQAQMDYGDGYSKKPIPCLESNQIRARQPNAKERKFFVMPPLHLVYKGKEKSKEIPPNQKFFQRSRAWLMTKADQILKRERKEKKEEEQRFNDEDNKELHRRQKQQHHIPSHPQHFPSPPQQQQLPSLQQEPRQILKNPTTTSAASSTATAATKAASAAATAATAATAASTATTASAAATAAATAATTAASNNQNSLTTSPTTESLEVDVVQKVLNGKKISCHGYSDKEIKLIKLAILLKGGIFVQHEDLARDVWMITQIQDRKDPIYKKCLIAGNQVVNFKWLLDSIKNAHVEEAWMYFPNNEMVSPEDCAELKQLMGRSHCLKEINISVSGFDPMEIARIELIVLLNNGIFNRGMNSNCNFLIMGGNDTTSEKYQAALKWGVKIVPLKWLESIHSMKKLPSDSVSVPAALRAEDEVNVDQELNSLPQQRVVDGPLPSTSISDHVPRNPLPQQPQPLSNRVEPSGDGQQSNVEAPAALENIDNEHDDGFLQDISNGLPADQTTVVSRSDSGAPMIIHRGRVLYVHSETRMRCRVCDNLFKLKHIDFITEINMVIGPFDENNLECVSKKNTNHPNCTKKNTKKNN